MSYSAKQINWCPLHNNKVCTEAGCMWFTVEEECIVTTIATSLVGINWSLQEALAVERVWREKQNRKER